MEPPAVDTPPGIPQWMQRTNILLGSLKVKRLIDAHVLVIGLGGVGGIAAEMLVRAGISNLTIVDNDTVDTTNRNRQVAALEPTIGKPKAEVLAERLLAINPHLSLTIKQEYISDGKAMELLKSAEFSYCLDCIDTLSSKCFVLRACYENKVPVVSSFGAGGKTKPELIMVSDISETTVCRFAQSVRKRLGKWNIRSGIPVVYSLEPIDRSRLILTPQSLKKNIIGTVSYMPAIFGCMVASIVIRDLSEGKRVVGLPPPPLSRSKLKRMKKKNQDKSKKGQEKAQEKAQEKEQKKEGKEHKRELKEEQKENKGEVILEAGCKEIVGFPSPLGRSLFSVWDWFKRASPVLLLLSWIYITKLKGWVDIHQLKHYLHQ